MAVPHLLLSPLASLPVFALSTRSCPLCHQEERHHHRRLPHLPCTKQSPRPSCLWPPLQACSVDRVANWFAEDWSGGGFLGHEISHFKTFLEPSEGTWLCQHLDFRHLCSSSVRQRISVVLSHLKKLIRPPIYIDLQPRLLSWTPNYILYMYYIHPAIYLASAFGCLLRILNLTNPKLNF